MSRELNWLLESEHAVVRYKTCVYVLGQDPESKDMHTLRAKIPQSMPVKCLLSERDAQGRIPFHPYKKWRGAHWVLSLLADLCYPPGDQDLMPLLEQVYAWLFSPHHLKSIQTIQGRVRRCASQEGNALYYSLALGLADERTERLAASLESWQWPDGGWNCDKKPAATHSSFHESLIPVRGLALYAQVSGDPRAQKAVDRAAEIFLERHLFRRRQDGTVMDADFMVLHYPAYWHYDVLGGLKVMCEAGFIQDERCKPALDWLQTGRLPAGGFPAEKKYYRTSEKVQSGRSLFDWGGVSKQRANEFVSVEALRVLQAAGRLEVK